MVAVLKLLRPGNCVMGLVGVLIGAMVGKGSEIFSTEYFFELWVGMAIAFFFMAAGNMLNDYFDSELDKVNHPERPIPAGLVKAGHVFVSAGLIFIILLLLGMLINLIMFLILTVATFLMLGYELVLKRRGFVGNITISILVGMLFLFGAAVVMEFGVVIILFVLATLATLAREIVKDIEDIKGDKDRATLPKTKGIPTARRIASAALIIAIILSPLPVLPQLIPFITYDNLSAYYFLVIIFADIMFITSIVHFSRNPHLASNTLKAGMAIALLAFALGSIL